MVVLIGLLIMILFWNIFMTFIVFTNCTIIVAVCRTIIRSQPRWFHSSWKTLLWMRFRPSSFWHRILQHIVFVWNFHFFLMTSTTSNRGRPRKISSCRSLFQFISDKLPQWRDTPTFCAYEWLQGRRTFWRRTWGWARWRSARGSGHWVIHFLVMLSGC